MKLTQCVTIVTFAFFSPDDIMKEAHFYFDPHEPRCNFLAGTEGDLLDHIITHFCPPRSTVLDMSGLQGKVDYTYTYMCTL